MLVGACTVFAVFEVHRGMRISVENATAPPAALSDVVVRVRGDEVRVGTIPRGERRTVHLHPHGESGIALAFVLNEHARETREAGYVDSDNYAANFVIRDGGQVEMSVCISFMGEGCELPFGPIRARENGDSDGGGP